MITTWKIVSYSSTYEYDNISSTTLTVKKTKTKILCIQAPNPTSLITFEGKMTNVLEYGTDVCCVSLSSL